MLVQAWPANEHFTTFFFTGQTDVPPTTRILAKKFHTLPCSVTTSCRLVEKYSLVIFFFFLFLAFRNKIILVTSLEHDTNTESLLCHNAGLGT